MLTEIDFVCAECGSVMKEYIAQDGPHRGEVLMACPRALKATAVIEPHPSPNYQGYSFFTLPPVLTVIAPHPPLVFYLKKTLLAQAKGQQPNT